jgi:hypothetical protein
MIITSKQNRHWRAKMSKAFIDYEKSIGATFAKIEASGHLDAPGYDYRLITMAECAADNGFIDFHKEEKSSYHSADEQSFVYLESFLESVGLQSLSTYVFR